MNNCGEYKGLLVGMLDGELTPEESRQVNDHLTRCAACRDDYEKLRQTTGKVASITLREPEDAVLDQMWKSPYSRFARSASIAMVIGGYTVLLAYALYEFFRSGKEAFPAKVAIGAIVIGFTLLLLQLVRERLRVYKTDRYKEIER